MHCVPYFMLIMKDVQICIKLLQLKQLKVIVGIVLCRILHIFGPCRPTDVSPEQRKPEDKFTLEFRCNRVFSQMH